MKQILTILTTALVANATFAQTVSVTVEPLAPTLEAPAVPEILCDIPYMEYVGPSALSLSVPVARISEAPMLNIHHVEGGVNDALHVNATHQLVPPPTIGSIASTFCDVVNCGDEGLIQ